MHEAGDRIISASEVGQYVYCARAWWLGSVQGRPSTHQREMTAGTAAHARHGRGVRASHWLSRLAGVTLLLAVVAGIVWWIGR